MGELYNPFPKLPKNIRQIGDADQVVRFYMEDYVNTYLKRLYPTGKQTIRVGILLGSVEYYDGTPYVFVDGAMEMEDVETDGEKVQFSEGAWKRAYQKIEETFPKRTIQGWFLCGGPGSQLSPLNYWKQHGQYFAGRNQLMYLNHGLEGDEAIFVTSDDGFYRLKGHCIYYERNQMMQDYMITRKDARRVESGAHETVIKDFRSRLSAKKEQAAARNRTANAMGVLCGVLSVAVLAGGVVLVNNYTKMQQMESVLASVLPANMESWEEMREQYDGGFLIEEIAGRVYPTEAAEGETAESYHAGNMSGGDGQASGGQASGTMQLDQPGEGNETNAAALSAADFGASADGQNGETAGNAGTSDDPTSAGTGNLAGNPTGSQGNASAGSTANGTGQASDPKDSNAGDSSVHTSAPTSDSGSTSPDTTQPLIGMGKESEADGQGDRADRIPPRIDYKAAEANGYKIYEIGVGETLYGICLDTYGSLNYLEEICRLNALEDVDHILSGQKLILP